MNKKFKNIKVLKEFIDWESDDQISVFANKMALVTIKSILQQLNKLNRYTADRAENIIRVLIQGINGNIDVEASIDIEREDLQLVVDILEELIDITDEIPKPGKFMVWSLLVIHLTIMNRDFLL